MQCSLAYNGTKCEQNQCICPSQFRAVEQTCKPGSFFAHSFMLLFFFLSAFLFNQTQCKKIFPISFLNKFFRHSLFEIRFYQYMHDFFARFFQEFFYQAVHVIVLWILMHVLQAPCAFSQFADVFFRSLSFSINA